MKRMKDVGEFQLIELIKKQFPQKGKDVVLGIGDDASVIRRNSSRHQVITSDAIVENVDFLLKKHAPEKIGRKLAAINLSDIAAMGGVPEYGVLSLGIKPDIPLSWMERFLKGMGQISKKFSLKIVGGDISRSGEFWASLTLMGRVRSDRCISRAHKSRTAVCRSA